MIPNCAPLPAVHVVIEQVIAKTSWHWKGGVIVGGVGGAGQSRDIKRNLKWMRLNKNSKGSKHLHISTWRSRHCEKQLWFWFCTHIEHFDTTDHTVKSVDLQKIVTRALCLPSPAFSVEAYSSPFPPLCMPSAPWCTHNPFCLITDTK